MSIVLQFIETCLKVLRVFSSNYANAITAIAALGTLLLAFSTLIYLKREYTSKYRPYVFPEVITNPFKDNPGFSVSIIPRNVGPHPCNVLLSDIKLTIGDEAYDTPNMNKPILLGRPEHTVIYPAGHVNAEGVKKIREARYKNNRIEISFVMLTMSIDKNFKEIKSYIFEINVMGEMPQPQFRSEWCKDVKLNRLNEKNSYYTVVGLFEKKKGVKV